MYLLGVDPGTSITGYGIIETSNNYVREIDSGIIKLKKNIPLPEKLEAIYNGIKEKIEKYDVDGVVIENAFYSKNVRTALVLGHARGVVMLAAQNSKVEILEFSPREIKKAVVGNGNASKEQVVFMIRRLLSLPEEKCTFDACDALAAALCGFYHYG